jgi:protein-tyrosine phosphatase
VGALYRSDSLSTLRGEDWESFQALGVRTLIDLRHEWEIAAAGRMPESDELRYHNFSIEHQRYDQAGLDPRVDAVSFLAERFAEVAADGVTRPERGLARVSAPPVGDQPISRRFGEREVRGDVVLRHSQQRRHERGDDPAAILTSGAVKHHRRAALAELMRLFLSDLAAKHGSVRDYTANLLGVTDDGVMALHVQYLGGDPG